MLWVGVPCRSASADVDETEKRLKSAGVDDVLRAKIQAAIARGVTFLVAHQGADGRFVEAGGIPTSVTGLSLLCALALQHAGTKDGEAPLARTIAAFFVEDPQEMRVIERNVYECSIALMLLAGLAGHDDVARRFAASLAAGLDEKTGWWGYDAPGSAGAGSTAPPSMRCSPNLSTTQFAALGLWAARRKGVGVPARVWVRHAESLCDLQSSRGSWGYLADRGSYVPSSAYLDGGVTNVSMGLANLLLARQVLESAGNTKPALLDRLTDAIVEARDELARAGPKLLASPGDVIGAMPGHGTYYTLYALEKACLFADVDTLDALRDPRKPKPAKKAPPWYATGARWLCDTQRTDGGWPTLSRGFSGRVSVVETAFALLFLLRSPSVFHPTTPRPIDARPRGATTPSVPGTPPAPESPPTMGD